MSVTIRRYEPQDLPLLHRVINEVCASVPFMATRSFQPTPAWLKVLAAPQCGDHLLLVALDGERVCGWCRLFPVLETGEAAFELGVGLRADRRGQGWGTQMVRWAQAWAVEQADWPIVLRTHPANLTAIRCFKRCRFRAVKSDNEGGIIMKWHANRSRGSNRTALDILPAYN